MLLVLRHGQSLWNVDPTRCQGQIDVPLSDQGRADANTRSREFPCPDAAYSSHLIRARETAEILLEGCCDRCDLPRPRLRIDSRLAEVHCGQWQGVLHRDLEKADPERWQALRQNDPDFAFPGGESLAQVLCRFTQAIEEIEQRHRHERALVISHGGPIRLLLADLGLDLGSGPKRPPRNLEGFFLNKDTIELLHHKK